MRLNKFLWVFQMSLLWLCNCSSRQSLDHRERPDIKPFEADITNSNYAMANAVLIIFTDKEIKIVLKSYLVGAKDSLLFAKGLPLSDTLKEISEINIRELKGYYSNPCIADGSQITVVIKKDGIEKSVHLSNYYQDDIGKLIFLVNFLVPKNYKIWYDKQRLQAQYKECIGSKN